MICLTGDVHHHSYRGADTWYSPYSEARLALRYSEIAARYGVRVTLFITGKACRQEPALIAELSRMPNCELGGHTYCAFRSPMHWLWKRLGFGVTGPVFFQARDIAKTVRAIERLTGTQGPDWSAWRWGRMHTQEFEHPFIEAFNLPTVERSGGTGTPFAGGASYREIMDVADWDRSVATNVPGQSGQPESPYYANLLPLWDRGEYFPMVYSRARVQQAATHTLVLQPR